MILREMGWDPLVATNGETGLPIFLQHQPHIALVVLDLAMPQMDGERFLHNIRRLDPHMPILISSGCLEEEAWDRFRDSEAVAFLQKPFQVEVLVEKIQALIGHTKSPSPINESVN